MSRFALLFTEQEASCYLPDKEFRYLRHFVTPRPQTERLGRFGSAQLSTSPWRSDHLIAPARGVWRMASEDSGSHLRNRPFLLIVRTGRIVTAPKGRVAPDTRMSQHIARFCNRPIVDGYSYRRRLPGLSFKALPPEGG